MFQSNSAELRYGDIFFFECFWRLTLNAFYPPNWEESDLVV
jgi:hypothetical protein